MSKVALMCGHGKSANGSWDPGTTWNGYTEANLMLPITKAAVKYLRSYGVEVISDADTNNDKNMIVDVQWANRVKTDIYVSLHCNYSQQAKKGTMPLYVSAKGKALATAINNAVTAGVPMSTYGFAKRTDLYELTGTDMPACIFETGCISKDIAALRDDPDKYGKCVAIGICNYLGVKAETVEQSNNADKNAALKAVISASQLFFGTPVDGAISGQDSDYADNYPALTGAVDSWDKTGSVMVKAVQRWVSAEQDGILGPVTVKAWQKKIGATVDGIFGTQSLTKWNEYLKTHEKADYPVATATATQQAVQATTGTTGASKILAKAKQFAGSAKKPTDAYKTALAKVYPNKKGWGTKSKQGRACDVFVGTVVRSTGLDKNCPRGLNEQLTHKPKSKNFQRIVLKNVAPYKYTKKGDVVIYNGSGGHACIRTSNGIYEANHSSGKYPHLTKSFSRLKIKRPKVVIWRAK